MVKSGTPAQVKKKFAEWGDYDWYGKCAAVVMTVCRHFGYVGSDTFSYQSANHALNAATIESTDWRDAPAGAVHYWDFYGKNSRGELGNWGHVGIDMTGGGRRVLNATHHADVRYGNGVGESTIPGISGRVGAYRGWSRKYGKSFYADIKPEPGGKPASVDPDVKRVALLYVNVRDKARTGRVVAVIPQGATVTIGSRVNGWVPVKYGKHTGWVDASLLMPPKRTILKDGTWFRTGPAGKAKAKLAKGTTVTVLRGHKQSDGSALRWVRVRVGLRVGWVAKGNLG